jgi:hypothetical protein
MSEELPSTTSHPSQLELLSRRDVVQETDIEHGRGVHSFDDADANEWMKVPPLHFEFEDILYSIKLPRQGCTYLDYFFCDLHVSWRFCIVEACTSSVLI